MHSTPGMHPTPVIHMGIKDKADLHCIIQAICNQIATLLLDIETVDEFLIPQIQLSIGNRGVRPDLAAWTAVF